MSQQITLYTAKICPYAHRAEIALAEAGAHFTRYEIDLLNKPEWYIPKVNPAGKVPAIAYGGPQVSPDQPSPESEKLNESLVLVEFIADLYPESGILPKDPVKRAKARLIIETVASQLATTQYQAVNLGKEFEPFYEVLETFQAFLPSEGFALGEFSIADIAVAPFLARIELILANDLGTYPAGQGIGQKVLDEIQSPRFARLQAYSKAVQSRPSFVATWDKDHVLAFFTKSYAQLRAEQSKAQK